MRVAIQVSGQPRFCKEFDAFLTNFTNYTQVDWFFHLWTSTHEQDDRVAPNWKSNDLEWVTNKIKSKLPEGHTIADIKLVDQPDTTPKRDYNLTIWSVPTDMFPMWIGIKEVTAMREAYEQEHGAYDLVVRARADLCTNMPLDCQHLHRFLSEYPSAIITCANHRHGLGGKLVSDIFAIGTSETMSIYSKVLDYIDEYNDIGLPFTNETLLAHHLYVNDIIAPMTDFECICAPWRSIPHAIADWGYWNEE